jgi:ethanolamine permease
VSLFIAAPISLVYLSAFLLSLISLLYAVFCPNLAFFLFPMHTENSVADSANYGANLNDYRHFIGDLVTPNNNQNIQQIVNAIESEPVFSATPKLLRVSKPKALQQVEKQLHVTALHWFYVFCFGIGLVISGEYFTFQFGIAAAGFGGYIIVVFVIAVAFLCLVFCLAELSSSFPFAGGSFGFGRAMVGRFSGYLVGLNETIEWVFSCLSIIYSLAAMFTVFFDSEAKLEPLWALIILCVALVINCLGHRVYWFFTISVTLISVATLLVYFFGIIHFSDFQANAGYAAGLSYDVPVDVNDDSKGVNTYPQRAWFVNGGIGALQSAPYAVWLFLGIEGVPLMAEETVNAKKLVPQGMIPAMVVLMIAGFLSVICSCAVPESAIGNLATAAFPLNEGFDLILSNGQRTTDPRLLALIQFPCLFISALTIQFCYGRQLFAMSRSGYLPQFIAKTWQSRGTPVGALLAGSVCVYAGYLLIYFTDPTIYGPILFNMGIIGALVNYCAMAICFIIRQYRFSAIQPPYKAPTGVIGAVFSFCVFFISFISVCVWVQWGWQAVIGVVILLAVGTVYYIVYARYHLIMSPEEYRTLFMIYTMKFRKEKDEKATIKPTSNLHYARYTLSSPQGTLAAPNEDHTQNNNNHNKPDVQHGNWTNVNNSTQVKLSSPIAPTAAIQQRSPSNTNKTTAKIAPL